MVHWPHSERCLLPTRLSAQRSKDFLSPTSVTYHCRKMWARALEVDGYAVVPGVLTPSERTRFRRQALDEAVRLAHMHHSKTLWDLRTLPSVRRLFEEWWGCTDLISGFDGMSRRLRGSDDYLAIDWHVDQDHTHPPGCCCVQALVALSDSTGESGTIEFVRGSHHAHQDLVWRLCRAEDAELDGTEGAWEFVPIAAGDPILCGDVVQPCVRAGDVVLWDARTVHRVVRPGGMAPRLVAYVCHVPRSFADDVTLQRRRKFFDEGVATTHWPHRLVDRGDERAPLSRAIGSDVPQAVWALV